MYNHKLIVEDQVFELGMTLPASNSSLCDNALRVDGTNGRLAVCVTAADDNVVLATTKKLTLSYTECDTETGSFTTPAPNQTLVKTASGSYQPDSGDVIMRMLLPTEVKKWVKTTLTTDDAAATGKVNVFLEYVGN